MATAPEFSYFQFFLTLSKLSTKRPNEYCSTSTVNIVPAAIFMLTFMKGLQCGNLEGGSIVLL